MERKKQRKQRQIKRATTKKQTSKTVKKGSLQISIFSVLLILVLIAACVGIYFGVRYLVITLKYKQYTDKMNEYGYNVLYVNSKATATEEVTKADLIKVVLGSLMNNTDINNIYHLASADVSDEQNWYDYAEDIGATEYIANTSLDSKSTRIDAIILATNTLEGIINKEIEQTELKMSESELEKYSEKQKVALSKAVTLGIIKNKNSALSEANILKGELNKLVIGLVEANATIYYKNTSTNAQVSIVTDKDKLPANKEDYPYIVDNISKEIYEQGFRNQYAPLFRTPKEVYKTMGYLYGQIDDTLTSYLNDILNIDYETITTKNFLEKIASNVVYEIDESDVEDYVQYVKDNKIKLEGKATALLPIMYDTGEGLVVRTKIIFKVINSDTQYNLLFGDENEKVKYTGDEIVMYVDVRLGGTFNSNSQLVYIQCLAKNLSSTTDSVVVEE